MAKLTKDQKRKKKLEAKKKKELKAFQEIHKWPLHKCVVSSKWYDEKDNKHHIHLIICRKYAGKMTGVVFLIDLLAKGVLDCFMLPLEEDFAFEGRFYDVERRLKNDTGNLLRDVSLDYAQRIIYSAVDWGNRFKLASAKDLQKSLKIVNPNLLKEKDIELLPCGNEDGVPIYTDGTYGSPLSDEVLELLEAAGGGYIPEPDDELEDWGVEPSYGAECAGLRFDEKVYGSLANGGAEQYADEITKKFLVSDKFKAFVEQEGLDESYLGGLIVEPLLANALLSRMGTISFSRFDVGELLFYYLHRSCSFFHQQETIHLSWREMKFFSEWVLEQYPTVIEENLEALIEYSESLEDFEEFKKTVLDPYQGGPSKLIAYMIYKCEVDMDDESANEKITECLNEAGFDDIEAAIALYKKRYK